jgi:putative transcriptional regulator
MARLTQKQLQARDRKRNLGKELLHAVRDMKAGRSAARHKLKVPAVVEARLRTGLSQAQFAGLLGVSTRTLQDWEQGRRNPSGAAKTLILIAGRMPEALQGLAA